MMNLHILISLLLPFFFLLSCSMSHHTNLQNQCLDNQQSCLMELQHHLYYAPNTTFSSKVELWDPNTDCCSWEGVTCDAVGHVNELDFNSKNLSGSFHSIFNLHHLQRLNLAGNNFNSTLIQYGFDKLPNLTHLNLSASCFHGQIPMEMSSLTRLVSLDLSNQHECYRRNHQFRGYASLKLEKPNLKTLIQNIRSLKDMYFDGVDISSESSKWCEITSLALPKLSVLSMRSCGLTGPLCSSLLSLPHLSKLILDGNSISYLPSNILKISSPLVSLSLRDCNLNGHFPVEFFLLPKIQKIDISNNRNLMGQLPEFPINNTFELQSLTLNFCNFSGSIPASIANLTNLVELGLRWNHFNGLIPPFHRSGVPNLAILDLSRNHLSGSIPSSLFTLPSLLMLDIGWNQLGGEIDELRNASFSLIEELDIGYNSFSPMKLDMFFQLENLRYLDLSNMSLLIGSNNKSGSSFPQLEWLSLDSCNLTKFPEFIKTQDKLRSLDLSNNQIHGEFPEFIKTQDKLSSLDLSYNKIHGVFPEFLKSLESLEELDLSNNEISGAVPSWVWKKSLQILYLSNNYLSSFDQCLLNHSTTSSQDSLSTRTCDFSQLGVFDASFNEFSGSIPSWLGNISTLWNLDLQQNNFSGGIPDFGGATQLKFLQLNDNKLEGKLPRSLANCTSLRVLYLQKNHFSGNIPDFGGATKLSTLVLNDNKLDGKLSRSLANCTSLRYLDLQKNNFSGSIPDLGGATQLETLELNDNKLEGKLPRSLANSTSLRVLNLGNNTLHDTFPLWLGKLPALMALILRGNRFYGPIKHLENNFPMLDVLDIASNNFSGQLSTKFFQATHLLRSLKIEGNKFEGNLPRSLANCTNLEVLDVGKNKIHDTFPSWLVKLPSLKVLILRSNRFYGSIQFSEGGHVFPVLRILDLAANNFSGELSVEVFQSLRAMMVIDGIKADRDYVGDHHYDGADYYQDSVTVVNKGHGILYQKILTIFTSLDLSDNSFHGRISEEIQELKSLHVLNMSYNNFFGPIPSALGHLTELESLDLSQNKLSGKIPQQLTSLTFLAVLNLSYNQLDGNLPQSYQFGTFLNDSYIGNHRLCGLPLTKKCNEVGSNMLPPKEDEDSWMDGFSVWKIVLMGYGCGLVIGVSIGYTVLNEFGNAWTARIARNWNRKWRRCR